MARPEVMAFLADIKANPDDDTPRLILADWLTDHDDPRGEFIRLQCRLARMETHDAEYKDLFIRSAELRVYHEADWLGAIFPLIDHPTFHRGLLNIKAKADKLFKKGGGTLALE